MRLERAHAQLLGQGQGLLVLGFGQRDIRRVSVGIDDAKLMQRKRLVPAFLVLPGQVEGLARVLPSLRAMSRQTTGLTELCDPAGLTLQPAGADPFADRLLQQRAPLHEASLEYKDSAQVRRKR